MLSRPVVGFIGTGKVGETLLRLLHQHQYAIGAIYNRTALKAQQLADELGVIYVEDMSQVVERCDLILLTVADDAIGKVAQELQSAEWQGKALVHVSGASSLDVLQVVQDADAMIGSLHPAYPFSSVETAIMGIRGATFAIEYSDGIVQKWLRDVVATMQGHVIEIPIGQKAQYHAALVIASNYLVTLYAVAQGLLADLSDDTPAIHQAIHTLMAATLQNLDQQGIPDALTGPLVRSDVDTIQSHLDALHDTSLIYDMYTNLAKLSYPMLMARGIDSSAIENLLRQDGTHASDDP